MFLRFSTYVPGLITHMIPTCLYDSKCKDILYQPVYKGTVLWTAYDPHQKILYKTRLSQFPHLPQLCCSAHREWHDRQIRKTLWDWNVRPRRVRRNWVHQVVKQNCRNKYLECCLENSTKQRNLQPKMVCYYTYYHLMSLKLYMKYMTGSWNW